MFSLFGADGGFSPLPQRLPPFEGGVAEVWSFKLESIHEPECCILGGGASSGKEWNFVPGRSLANLEMAQ